MSDYLKSQIKRKALGVTVTFGIVLTTGETFEVVGTRENLEVLLNLIGYENIKNCEEL